MKTLILICTLLLLSGCATQCETCLTLTPAQLGKALGTAWQDGFGKGFDAGEDSEQTKRLRAL